MCIFHACVRVGGEKGQGGVRDADTYAHVIIYRKSACD